MEFVCQYDVREILGQGSFTEVKRCIDKRTRQAFAVKEMAYNTVEQKDKIEQEIRVSYLMMLCCPVLKKLNPVSSIGTKVFKA